MPFPPFFKFFFYFFNKRNQSIVIANDRDPKPGELLLVDGVDAEIVVLKVALARGDVVGDGLWWQVEAIATAAIRITRSRQRLLRLVDRHLKALVAENANFIFFLKCHMKVVLYRSNASSDRPKHLLLALQPLLQRSSFLFFFK